MPGREGALAYSGGTVDRAGNLRADPGWVAAVLAGAGTRLIPMWRDQCIVSAEPASPAILPAAQAGPVLAVAAEPVFLGLDDDGGLFAAGLSALEQSEAVEVAGSSR